MESKTKEELKSLLAKEIKDLGLNDIFKEDGLDEIQRKISERLNMANESVLEEEVMPEQEEIVPEEPSSEEPIITPVPSSPPVANVTNDEMAIEPEGSTYEPVLPDVISDVEPEKFVIFDKNEVSFGGEQLANKPFRLFSNPDEKRSIHDAWKTDAKKTADVYVAKFEKVGTMEFDYTNGTAQFIDKRFESPEDLTSEPVFKENPYSEDPTPQEVDTNERGMDSAIKNAVDVEGQFRGYIEDVLKKHFSEAPTNNGVTGPAVDDYENEILNQDALRESTLVYREVVMNEDLMNVATPTELKESIDNKNGKAKLIAKNDQVQTWVLEGVEYHLPATIISNNKCYTKKTL